MLIFSFNIVPAYFAERDRSFRGSVTGGGMMNAWW